jgi:hypothetical protein
MVGTQRNQQLAVDHATPRVCVPDRGLLSRVAAGLSRPGVPKRGSLGIPFGGMLEELGPRARQRKVWTARR